jgi:uncharacterized membrane protein YfcA
MFGIDPKTLQLIALGGCTAFYIDMMVRRLMNRETAVTLRTGFITNFFDTLGIGSFATTTAIFRKWKLVPDEHIPGTLNVGHTLPTITQAFIFTTLVPVEATTLILMIAAAVAGSVIGAGVVVKWPRRRIQIGMGTALIIAAFLMLMAFAGNVGPDFGAQYADTFLLGYGIKLLRLIAVVLQPIVAHMPKGGTLLALTGSSLVIGLAGNFLLGTVMPLGIGLYGPCMLLIYFLGMDPKAAFPIMMGSCAFLMPAASAKFLKAESYDLKASLGLMLGGVPAVLLAAYVVKSMPLDAVRLLVVIVVLYTAYGLLTSARTERAATGS